MRNQNLGIPIKHQSDGVPKEVGDRAVFTVHFLWWLSSQNQKLNEDTKIKCGVLLMWYTVLHLECTSNSLGATSLWPAGLPKARKIQTYLIYIYIYKYIYINIYIYPNILLIFCQLLKGFTTSKSTADEISPGWSPRHRWSLQRIEFLAANPPDRS